MCARADWWARCRCVRTENEFNGIGGLPIYVPEPCRYAAPFGLEASGRSCKIFMPFPATGAAMRLHAGLITLGAQGHANDPLGQHQTKNNQTTPKDFIWTSVFVSQQDNGGWGVKRSKSDPLVSRLR